MPYIKQHKRENLNKVVEFMGKMRVLPTGDLNYILYKYCKEWMKWRGGESYNAYKEFIGELECCKSEIYRRQVVKYEEEKIKENGDVA